MLWEEEGFRATHGVLETQGVLEELRVLDDGRFGTGDSIGMKRGLHGSFTLRTP